MSGVVLAPVVAQVWPDGSRQAVIAALLQAAWVPMTEARARAIGILAGASGHSDVVDVMVALEASRAMATVITSDPADTLRVAPGLSVEPI